MVYRQNTAPKINTALLHRAGEEPHFHQELEILYLMEGTLTVALDGKEYDALPGFRPAARLRRPVRRGNGLLRGRGPGLCQRRRLAAAVPRFCGAYRPALRAGKRRRLGL
ncbi:MAG TPA: cupin domain-containing protein [Candidatus Gemmiger excrementavium]|uniref:Cupin domain-containing protein n=1 Tax=Candidatus Gemmiger excrementavium TaxID=2838608 RepID=A0A9D2F2R0_9FIRM|nr:cupin domain-containing protein [Candidatus Gemmiger excrementavium]